MSFNLDDLQQEHPPSTQEIDLLAEFDVEYYDYDCGKPCTPNGCCGHSTNIPVSFTVGGVTFHVDGAQSGDFPNENENVNRVCAVVKAMGALISANDKQPNK